MGQLGRGHERGLTEDAYDEANYHLDGLSDDLAKAGELASQATTNNSRTLRKTYIMAARKILDNVKKTIKKSGPATQAAIRRVDYLVEEVEKSFPELIKKNYGLSDYENGKATKYGFVIILAIAALIYLGA